MIGNEEDFTACLGFEVEGVDEHLTELDTGSFQRDDRGARRRSSRNFAVVATTLRTVRSATVNDWSAIAWSRDGRFVEATARPGLEILDRVGGGDSFASGLIYGLLEHGDLPASRRVRRRARRAGDDHARRHLDGALAEVEALVRGAAPGYSANRPAGIELQILRVTNPLFRIVLV